jgi:hypothetical protein
MKRFFVVLMTLLFAGSAFAQDVKTEEKKGPDFSFGLKGAVFGATGSWGDDAYDYSHIRLRPTFTANKDNVKGVLTFEIDQDFGRGDKVKNADPGTDNYAVEVKHAYLEAKDVIIPGLSLMGGLNEYSFPLVVKNDFALAKAGFDFGIGKVFLSYIAIEEQGVMEETTGGEANDDVSAYAVDLPLKFGAISVRPGLIYIAGGNAAVLDPGPGGMDLGVPEAGLTNLAINVKGDMGMVAFNVSGAYLTGDINSAITASAYAVDLNVDVKPVEGIKVGAFFTMGSGDDGATHDEVEAYFYIMNTFLGKIEAPFSPDGKTSSGAPDGRLFLLENASASSNGGVNFFDAMDAAEGYMSYGLYAEAKMDKLALFAQVGMASYIEEDAGGNTAIGTEIDLRASYTIGSKTDLFVEGAYIMKGDVMEDSAYQAILGVTTSL